MGTNTAGSTFYVDFERIRKHGGYVYYWYSGEFSKPDKDGELSYQTYIQGDCKLFRVKTLSETYYKESMRGGTARHQFLNKLQKDWKYAPPDSMMEHILKKVCSR